MATATCLQQTVGMLKPPFVTWTLKPEDLFNCLTDYVYVFGIPTTLFVPIYWFWQDPREELLKFDEETKKDKEFLGSAYKASQPDGGGMYHRTLEEEEEDFKEEQRKLLDS